VKRSKVLNIFSDKLEWIKTLDVDKLKEKEIIILYYILYYTYTWVKDNTTGEITLVNPYHIKNRSDLTRISYIEIGFKKKLIDIFCMYKDRCLRSGLELFVGQFSNPKDFSFSITTIDGEFVTIISNKGNMVTSSDIEFGLSIYKAACKLKIYSLLDRVHEMPNV